MAAIGAYTNPTWVDGSAPALSASNLQALTDQVKNITDAAVSGGASPTKIWTSTNDGNSGTAPAPKNTILSGTLTLNQYHEYTLSNGIYLVTGTNISVASTGAVAIVFVYGATYIQASLRTEVGAVGITAEAGSTIRITNLHNGSDLVFASCAKIGF